jgi:biotin carboxyl carrier protein
MQDRKFHLKVNEGFSTELHESDAAALDVLPLGENKFHLLRDEKSYSVELLEFNPRQKTLLLKVNHSKYRVKVEDELDMLVQKMGLGVVKKQKINEIRAPMPGLVLSVVAKEGQVVEIGETLLILEAMKMENIIKSPGEGTIKKIHIEKGKAVDRGELLIELE